MTCRFLGALLIVGTLVLGGCGGSSGDSQPLGPQLSTRQWVTGEELQANPDLHAQHHQTVILQLDDRPAVSGLMQAATTVHRLNYYSAVAGPVSYRLDADNACIDDLRIQDATGLTLLHIDRNAPAARAQLPAGHHTVTVAELVPLPSQCGTLFLNVNKPADGKLASTAVTEIPLYGSTVWRALWFDGKADEEGLLVASGFSGGISGYSPVRALMSSAASKTKTSFLYDDRQNNGNLLMFSRQADDQWRLSVKSDASNLAPLSSVVLKRSQCIGTLAYAADPGYLCYLDYYNPLGMTVAAFMQATDSAPVKPEPLSFSHEFNPVSHRSTLTFAVPFKPYFANTNCAMPKHSDFEHSQSPPADCGMLLSGVTQPKDMPTYAIKIAATEAYRYYSDAEKLRNLALPMGEVALFTGTNYTGQAVVFNADTLDSKFFKKIFFGFPVRSIRVASDVTAAFGDDPNHRVDRDLPEVATLPFTYWPADLSIFRAADVVVSNNCVNCNLTGADLRKMDLHGRDFSGSIFTNALLTNAHAEGASFVNAIFYGSDLSNADFTGANLAGSTLTNAQLTLTDFTSADLSLADLSNCVLYETKLMNTSLKGATLERADLTKAIFFRDGLLPPQFQNAKMQSVTLDGFKLQSIDFSGVDMSHASLKNTQSSGVKFPGAILNFADLTGATLQDGQLKANLHGASLQYAVLDGLNLNDFDLTDAALTGASLKSTSLKKAVLKGAVLSNTNMEGANLCGADLTKSTNGKQVAAKLSGAYMKNVNLAFADLTNVSMQSVSLHNQDATACAPSDCKATSSSCSTVYKAILTDVNLSRSYIAGLDLSNAILYGTDLSYVFGQGANFSGAEIMPSNGKPPNFTNAVLIGANFMSATVAGASFDNAYFGDPAKASGTAWPKTAITFLSSAYTAGNPTFFDKNVCPIFFIPTLSSDFKPEDYYPKTNSTTTCPDSTLGPCRDSQWRGNARFWPDTVALSYSQQFSYPPGCTSYDLSW